MALQQRSRKMTIGFFEVVLFALLASTLIAGILCWQGTATANWKSTRPWVTGLAMVANRGTAADDDAHIEVSFTYTVAGRSYTGRKLLNRLERALIGTLPDEVMSLLRARGYLNFGDLPPKVQALLRERGVMSFSEIPLPFLEWFDAKGPQSLDDIPEEAIEAARNKDYDTLAKMFDEELARTNIARSADPSTTREMQEASVTVRRTGPVLRTSGGASASEIQGIGVPLMRVFYDPENPANYRVSTVPMMKRWTSLMLFAVCLALTFAYAAFLYPRLVREFRR